MNWKSATGCALTGGVCYSTSETDQKTCCLPSDACLPDVNTPYTYTCQHDCAAAGEECYTPTVMKSCCDLTHACLFDEVAALYNCNAPPV